MVVSSHAPPSVQFQVMAQSGVVMTSIRPARDSISNRHSTSPPSGSYEELASIKTSSNEYFPDSILIVPLGDRPMKISTLAWLLLLFASPATNWSGSTVNVKL